MHGAVRVAQDYLLTRTVPIEERDLAATPCLPLLSSPSIGVGGLELAGIRIVVALLDRLADVVDQDGPALYYIAALHHGHLGFLR
jgi:hypothetical protein